MISRVCPKIENSFETGDGQGDVDENSIRRGFLILGTPGTLGRLNLRA